jgi:hypothetical protein
MTKLRLRPIAHAAVLKRPTGTPPSYTGGGADRAYTVPDAPPHWIYECPIDA